MSTPADPHNTTDVVQDEVKKLHSNIYECTKRKNDLDESIAEAVIQIRTTFEKIRQLLALKEESLVSHIQKRHASSIEKLDAFVHEEEKKLQTLEQTLKASVDGTPSPDQGRLCVNLKAEPLPKLPSVFFENHEEDAVDTITKLQVYSVRFVEEGHKPFTEVLTRHPLHLDGDSEESDIKDIAVLGDQRSTLLLTDFRNKCVKTLHSINGQIQLSSAKTDHAPWGIAKLSDDEVAVTVPGSKQILFIRVTGNDLEITKTVKTKYQYRGVAWLSDCTFVVCSDDPASVHKLNSDGQWIKDLAKCYTFPFETPTNIGVTAAGNLAVLDSTLLNVVLLDKTGRLICLKPSTKAERRLKSTGGIDTDDSGNIFVVDTVSNCVLMINEDDSNNTAYDVTDERIESPTAVCLDGKGRMYVADERYLNVIKISYV